MEEKIYSPEPLQALLSALAPSIWKCGLIMFYKTERFGASVLSQSPRLQHPENDGVLSYSNHSMILI